MNQNRDPKGQPTGGQFRERERSADSISLAPQAPPTTLMDRIRAERQFRIDHAADYRETQSRLRPDGQMEVKTYMVSEGRSLTVVVPRDTYERERGEFGMVIDPGRFVRTTVPAERALSEAQGAMNWGTPAEVAERYAEYERLLAEANSEVWENVGPRLGSAVDWNPSHIAPTRTLADIKATAAA